MGARDAGRTLRMYGSRTAYMGQVLCSSLFIRDVLRSTATTGTSVMSVVLGVK